MPKHFLITVAFLAIAAAGHAQFMSELGRFQVTDTAGCAPLTVNIVINAPSFCGPCDLDYQGNNNFVSYSGPTELTHTYAQPGTYWLRIVFESTGIDSVKIVVKDNLPPAFDIYTCGGNEVIYDITDTNYDEYVVNFNDGSPDVIVPVGGSGGNHTYTISGPQAITVRGRHAGALDNCTATGQPFVVYPVLPIPMVSSLVVLDDKQI